MNRCATISGASDLSLLAPPREILDGQRLWYKQAADINTLIIMAAAPNHRTITSMPTPKQLKLLGDRVKWRRLARKLTQKELARLVGLTQPTISSLERNESTSSLNIAKLATALQCNALWLETGRGDPELFAEPIGYERTEQPVPLVNPMEISTAPSKGSCGGHVGAPSIDQLEKSLAPVLVLPSALKRHRISPDKALAVIADGAGMENLILHGDVVLFATTKTKLVDGNVYAFSTRQGTKIRRVFLRHDGCVTLAFDSPDKSRFPNEDFSPEAAAKLKCLGEYFYRQG
jgi:transcriptional regulator with XRE-family HTH domain